MIITELEDTWEIVYTDNEFYLQHRRCKIENGTAAVQAHPFWSTSSECLNCGWCGNLPPEKVLFLFRLITL